MRWRDCESPGPVPERQFVDRRYLIALQRVKTPHALNQAVEDGLVVRNVAAPVRTSKKVSKKARPLDLNKTSQFLRAIRGDRLEALYRVALLGLRQGEVVGLRWQDVDLSIGRLEVRQGLQRVRGRYELVDPKTEGSRRPVKLPPTVVVRLR